MRGDKNKKRDRDIQNEREKEKRERVTIKRFSNVKNVKKNGEDYKEKDRIRKKKGKDWKRRRRERKRGRRKSARVLGGEGIEDYRRL